MFSVPQAILNNNNNNNKPRSTPGKKNKTTKLITNCKYGAMQMNANKKSKMFIFLPNTDLIWKTQAS